MLLAGSATGLKAQSGDMMIAVGAGVLAPACTNCNALVGPLAAFTYSFTNHIAVTAQGGLYSRKDGGYKTNAVAVGAAGEFYVRESMKGFFVSADITYISVNEKLNSTKVFDESNITFGASIGWAIPIVSFRIIPYLGYGTWFEDSKGRIMAGGKVAFKLP